MTGNDWSLKEIAIPRRDEMNTRMNTRKIIARLNKEITEQRDHSTNVVIRQLIETTPILMSACMRKDIQSKMVSKPQAIPRVPQESLLSNFHFSLVSPHVMRGRELSTLVVRLSFLLCVTLEFHFEAVRQQHRTFYSHRSFSTAGKSLFLLSCCV